MKYLNRRTGKVIDVDGIIRGDDWEPVAEKVEKPKAEEPKKEGKRK